MNTSKYDSVTRKSVKRFQRSPGYAEMKKLFEAKLHDRDATIADLKAKLAAAASA